MKRKIIRVCPKYKNCIIFRAKTVDDTHAEIYKKIYCTAGIEKYEKCKRYIISEKTGVSPPEEIMPNSIYSIDEILTLMKEQHLIDN